MGILGKGLVQVYTGPGKGKTTAAVGAAWRMLGWGGRVYMCQFLKPASQRTGEAALAGCLSEGLGSFTLERLDEPWNMVRGMDDVEQVGRMRRAIGGKLPEIRELARSGDYDLVILDEIVVALSMGLADRAAVYGIMDERAEHVELVLTGRGADDDLIGRADLVTRMEKASYVRKVRSRKDQRVVKIQMQPKGEKLLKKTVGAGFPHARRIMMPSLSEEEIKQLDQLLKKLRNGALQELGLKIFQ